MKLRHHFYILGSLIAINLAGYFFQPEIVRLPHANGRTLLLIVISFAPLAFALFLCFKLKSRVHRIAFLVCVIGLLYLRLSFPSPSLLYQRRYVFPLAQDAEFQEYTKNLREYFIDRKPDEAGPVSAVFLSTKSTNDHALENLAKLFGRGRLIIAQAEQGKAWRAFHISTRDRNIPVSLNLYIIHYGKDMLDYTAAREPFWINDFTPLSSHRRRKRIVSALFC